MRRAVAPKTTSARSGCSLATVCVRASDTPKIRVASHSSRRCSRPASASQQARSWQQFWIALRRIAPGLSEDVQVLLRSLTDPWLAPAELKLKKPKQFRPLALEEQLELASWLERVPVEFRIELGRWLLERTWTSRDPRLWAALGRIGARVPAYASAHHVLPPSIVERQRPRAPLRNSHG